MSIARDRRSAGRRGGAFEKVGQNNCLAKEPPLMSTPRSARGAVFLTLKAYAQKNACKKPAIRKTRRPTGLVAPAAFWVLGFADLMAWKIHAGGAGFEKSAVEKLCRRWPNQGARTLRPSKVRNASTRSNAERSRARSQTCVLLTPSGGQPTSWRSRSASGPPRPALRGRADSTCPAGKTKESLGLIEPRVGTADARS